MQDQVVGAEWHKELQQSQEPGQELQKLGHSGRDGGSFGCQAANLTNIDVDVAICSCFQQLVHFAHFIHISPEAAAGESVPPGFGGIQGGQVGIGEAFHKGCCEFKAIEGPGVSLAQDGHDMVAPMGVAL